ncbi:transporter substrate-binding domain-containing protein [Motilimonas sp. 1_MG-2023]|uniref:transporter substrate-binding domain-containing protein n=1 Tax=Motilimonas sp. 1_MG-2023 TaxID=3062672 RepID=UPI0026E25777|nr:transporter substrate-binding domain-containing protein [Motilimonas sp. 1_MG-2023]
MSISIIVCILNNQRGLFLLYLLGAYLLFYLVRFTQFTLLVCCFISSSASYANDLKLTPEEEAFLTEHPVIRVSNETDWPPLDFVDNQTPAGYSIDYLDIIADKIGVKFDYVNGYSWFQLLEQAKAKEIDLMHVVADLPERQDFLLFSKPYFELHSVIVTSPNNAHLSHLAALQDRTLAVISGYYSTKFIAKHYPNIKLLNVASPVEALRAVATNKADAYIDNLATVNYLIEKHLLASLVVAGSVDVSEGKAETLHIGVRKDWPLLHSIINKAMAEIKESELIALRKKWLGEFDKLSQANALNLTQVEQDYLSTLGILSLCADPDWMPYDKIDEQGRHQGLFADYIQLISKRLKLDILLKPTDSWQATLDEAQAGNCDLISGIINTPQRQHYLNFSQPFLSSPVAIISQSDNPYFTLEQLNGKTLALVEGYSDEAEITRSYPEINIKRYKDVSAGLVAAATGEVDATLGTLFVSLYHIQAQGLANLRLHGFTPFNNHFSVGIGHKDPILTSIINKALINIAPEEHIALRKQWLSTNDAQHNSQLIENSLKAGLDIEFNNELFTLEQQAYLSHKPWITMCVDPDWAPFEWIDQQQQHQGIVADTIKLYEAKLGKQFKLIPSRNWTQTLAKARQRECDIISAAAKTPSRVKYLDFGEAFMKLPVVVVTRELPYFIGNLGQIEGEPIGVVAGYSLIELVKEKYPRANIVEVRNVEKGIEMVSSGELFAFLDTVASVSHVIQQGKISNVKINGATGLEWSIGVATRNDEPLLREIFDIATRDIKPTEHDEIFNRWINIKYLYEGDYRKLWPIALSLFALLSLFIYWNRKLSALNRKINNYLDIIDHHVLNLKIDTNQNIIDVSDAFCQTIGIAKYKLLNSDFRLLYDNVNSEETEDSFFNAIQQQQHWQGEFSYRYKNNQKLTTQTFLSPLKRGHQVIGFSVIQQDITDKKRIENITRIDELTGLFNRRHFNEIFPKELARAKRDNKLFGFMIIDVDNFKAFNDTYGHPKGDQVLIDLAKALKSNLHRACDYVFRLGGEEFAVIVSGAVLDSDISDIAYRLKESVEALQITHVRNQPYDIITISVGVNIVHFDQDIDQETIYQQADDALYQAKGHNRNCVLLAK